MDIQNIITLINAVSDANITNFKIEEGNFKLMMDKLDHRIEASSFELPTDTRESINQPPVSSIVQEVTENNVAKEENIVNLNTSIVASEDSIKEVCSPIVGTYYSSSGPDSDDFVKVGDKVKKGQTLCIIEAMKLMNDIESDYNGEIVEVLIKNEDMVEYNQPLFKIKVD